MRECAPAVTKGAASRADVATVLALSLRRVHELVAEGTLPRLGHGRYDLYAVAHAYIVFCHSRLRREPSPRARLLEIRVQRKQFALEQELASVIAVADHEAAIVCMARTARAVFGAVGRRVAPQIVALGSGATRAAVQAVIDNAQREALSEMARTLPSKLMPKRRRRKKRLQPVAPVMRLERQVRASTGVEIERPARPAVAA